MRFLLDQGLPRSVAALLREMGLDAIHTGECGLANALDSSILGFAREKDYIVVTLDADFHSLMALSHEKQPSVIRIRIEGLKSLELKELILHVQKCCQDDLVKGSLVSVTENRIRLHLLPIA
jgi:predicted nuclease of predicted toxin-antitoxin system